MQPILLTNVHIVNEGRIVQGDVLIDGPHIAAVGTFPTTGKERIIDGQGKYLLPGVIDAQVHFRDPGLTHKADLYTESKAAVAGGVTSFIDMPNTRPNTLTVDLLQEKYELAASKSLANFGFLLGVNHENIDAVIAMDKSRLLGVTDDGLYFSGKGNLLADNPAMLERLFAHCHSLIAIHAEKEHIIEANEQAAKEQYGEDVPFAMHPIIRSEEACLKASKEAIDLANKHKARLHILHLSTAAETHLFRNDIPLTEKNITTEVSVHHLWFCDQDYERLGPLIKWNPAIKTKEDQQGLLAALLDDRIDIITTDHAPHTLAEKQQPYFQSMSGAPMIQHSLVCMLEFYHRGLVSLEKIAEKMSHHVAVLYGIHKRGYIREGYYADLVLVDLNAPWTVSQENLLYKCGWSPLEGTTFRSRVTHTFVNGLLVYENGRFDEGATGMALEKVVYKH